MESPTDDRVTKARRRTMRAAVLHDVERMEVRDVPFPEMGPKEILLAPSAVGLCGTDFHIYTGHANYNTDGRGQRVPLSVEAQILGHEITGVVSAAGEGVTDLKAGDRVVIDQGINCVSRGRVPLCEFCASGNSHQCLYYLEHGIAGLPGGLAEYVSVPAVNAVPIESEIDPAEAVLTEPLGCVIHAIDVVSRSHLRYGLDTRHGKQRARAVLILGAGPAGLLFTQYLRQAVGYDGTLIVSEPNSGKRELAAQFGAMTFDPGALDLVEEVRRLTDGRMVDVLIEVSGFASAFTSITSLIRKQATVLLYGHGHAGADLSVLNNLMFLEPCLITPVGASGGFDEDGRPATFRKALRLLEQGRIRVRPLITNRYPSITRVPEAFSGLHLRDGYIKGVVEM